MRALGVDHDRERRHGGAERHDLGRPMPGLHVGLDGALHDAPLAHAKLVALALLVELLHGALEDVVAQRLVIRPALPGARRLDDLHVQPLVGEEAFVARHQQGQVVDGIHHRGFDFPGRSGIHGISSSSVLPGALIGVVSMVTIPCQRAQSAV